jgi:hypothetical protein
VGKIIVTWDINGTVPRSNWILETDSMKSIPSCEATILSDGQQITSILLNSKVRYRVYNSPLLVPILSQMNPIHTGYRLDDLCSGVRVWRMLQIFLFSTAFRPALGPTQPPIQWVLGALSLGEKRLRREADHSPPSRTDVDNTWSYTPLPHTPSWRGAQLKARTGTTLHLPLYWWWNHRPRKLYTLNLWVRFLDDIS